jgi:cellulose synthase operon protein C
MKIPNLPRLRTILQIAAVLAVLLLGGRLLTKYNNRANAAEAFAKARDYRAQNNLVAARVELMNAVQDDPGLVDALIMQAEVALDMFDGTTARTALEKAVERGIDQLQVQHLIGHALYLENDFERAEQMLDSDEIPKKHKAYALRILGRVLQATGNIDESRDAFDQAIKLGRENSPLWTDIGYFRLNLADQMGAIEAADYAVKLDNKNIRALGLRAQLVRSQYGMAAALPWYESALALNPNDVPLLEEYAATLGELGRASDMLKVLRKIHSLQTKNGRAFYMQAVIAARAGEFSLAQRILLLAGTQINETPGAMLVSAICEYQLGNHHRAADILERLVGMQPNNFEARKLLARAKQSAGENFEALDAIKPLVDRGQADSYTAMIAARAFEANGERKKAADELGESSRASVRKAAPISTALSLRMAADGAQKNPGNAKFAIPYIRALMLDGQPEQALIIAKQLQANSPGVPEAHMLVGDILASRGQYGAAVTDYQRARQINFSEAIMLRQVDVYRRLNQAANARTVLREYTMFNPNNLSAQRLMAYLMLDEARWADAIPLLEKLRGRVGYNDSILNANIARAYSGAGRHDDAIFNAETAYRIDPANPMVTLVYAQVLMKSEQRPKAALELFEKADALVPGNADVAKGLKAAKAAMVKQQPKPAKK